MCARKGMVFPVVVPGRVQNVKKIAQNQPNFQLYQSTTFQQKLCHKGYTFLWICASKGIDFGLNFVPVRVGFCKFCATEGFRAAVLAGVYIFRVTTPQVSFTSNKVTIECQVTF